MTSITLEIRGVEKLNRKLSKLSSASFRRPMLQTVTTLEKDLKTYPAARANSTYRRTGTLGRRWGWTIQGRGQGMTGRVTNPTIYAPYVQSAQRQAKVHRQTWRQKTDKYIVEKRLPKIVGFWTDYIKDLLK